MHLKYHLTLGISQDLLMDTFPIATIASISPDLPLLKNEIKLRINNENFNPKNLSILEKKLYFLTHSFLVCLILLFIERNICIAWFIHVLFDLFTHTGELCLRPFTPFSNWKFPFGKEVLKK